MVCASLTEIPVSFTWKIIYHGTGKGSLSEGGEEANGAIGKGKRRQQLHKELKAYEKAGLKLLLDGQPSSVKEIARACTVKEEANYMRDYIRDDEEQIIGISFDLVREE